MVLRDVRLIRTVAPLDIVKPLRSILLATQQETLFYGSW